MSPKVYEALKRIMFLLEFDNKDTKLVEQWIDEVAKEYEPAETCEFCGETLINGIHQEVCKGLPL